MILDRYAMCDELVIGSASEESLVSAPFSKPTYAGHYSLQDLLPVLHRKPSADAQRARHA